MSDYPKVGLRERLPTRRRSESRKIIWQPPHNVDAPKTKLFVSIGYAEDGLRPVELFYDGGYRSGSDLETLVSDLCITLSVLIQHDGVQIESFAHSLSKELDLRSGAQKFGSLVGVLINQLLTPPQWAAAVAAAAEDLGHE